MIELYHAICLVSTALQIYFRGFSTMTLPDAFKRFRKHYKITQRQAAAAAGASERNYQDYEYGKVIPSAAVLIALSDYYDCSIDYLVGRSDDQTRH